MDVIIFNQEDSKAYLLLLEERRCATSRNRRRLTGKLVPIFIMFTSYVNYCAACDELCK